MLRVEDYASALHFQCVFLLLYLVFTTVQQTRCILDVLLPVFALFRQQKSFILKTIRAGCPRQSLKYQHNNTKNIV